MRIAGKVFGVGIAALALGVAFGSLTGCNMPTPPDYEEPPPPPPVEAGAAHVDPLPHEDGTHHLGAIAVTVPEDWAAEPPTGDFRVAVYRLPRQGEDEADGEMVVSSFPGGVGPVHLNIERWASEFAGEPEVETAELTLNELEFTRVSITGDYTGPKTGEAVDLPGYRMLAALVDVEGEAFSFKLVGPQATLDHWEASFDEFLESVRAGQP